MCDLRRKWLNWYHNTSDSQCRSVKVDLQSESAGDVYSKDSETVVEVKSESGLGLERV